jgi:hypothetical protein
MTPMTTGIRTPFDFSSTADDVIDGIDLSGRRAIVTGGSSGIGQPSTRAHRRGLGDAVRDQLHGSFSP